MIVRLEGVIVEANRIETFSKRIDDKIRVVVRVFEKGVVDEEGNCCYDDFVFDKYFEKENVDEFIKRVENKILEMLCVRGYVDLVEINEIFK